MRVRNQTANPRLDSVSDGLPRCRRTSAREELRLQLGTLRFDLNSLASNLEKPKRKAADEAKKAFYAKARPRDE